MLFTPKGEGDFVAAVGPGQIFGVVLESTFRGKVVTGAQIAAMQLLSAKIGIERDLQPFPRGNSFSGKLLRH